MIFREALRSIRNDKVRAFFYWLTFMLTTMFILLFFNISVSIPESNSVTLVTMLVVLICTIDIFFANNFFVKAKAKELAVRLVCGASFSYLAGYLLIQTTLLLLLALPVGCLLTVSILPLANVFLSTSIAMTMDAFGKTALMIGYVIFWTVLLNLSFSYKSAASMMLNTNGTLINGSANVLSIGGNMKGLKKIFFTLLYAAPVVIFFSEDSPAYLAIIVGMLGLAGAVGNVYIPHLDKLMKNKYASDEIQQAKTGFYRMDLRMLKTNILLYNVSTLLLFSLSLDEEMNTPTHALMILSFLMVALLMALAIMFKYATIMSSRTKHFKILSSLGFEKSQADVIMKKEVQNVYSFVFISGGVYFAVMLFAKWMMKGLALSQILIASAGFILPLLLCYFLSLFYFKRCLR